MCRPLSKQIDSADSQGLGKQEKSQKKVEAFVYKVSQR